MRYALVLALVVLTSACDSLKSRTDVEPSGPLPAISFTVSPSSGKAPLTVTLSWSVSNCARASISTIGDVACNGSMSRTVTATTEYNLTAANAAGDERSQRQTATITP